MDEHRDDVWRFVAAVAGPQEADDCFQETFLAALRGYPKLRNATNLKGWLMTIAYRKAVDSHRGSRNGAVPTDAVPGRPAKVDPRRRTTSCGTRSVRCRRCSARRSRTGT